MAARPAFPPLLTGHAVPGSHDPLLRASRRASAGKAGAGDVFWRESFATLDAAIVLEPEVSPAQAREMLFVAMVAIADSIGALCPPELGIFYRWPDTIRANGADIGLARLVVADADDAAAPPQWLAVAVTVAVRPGRDDTEPGYRPDRTTLWDEGCTDVDPLILLESYSRHFKNWLHKWETEGVRPVREAWLVRAEDRGKTVTVTHDCAEHSGTFLGLDDAGGLVLKSENATVILDLATALAETAPLES